MRVLLTGNNGYIGSVLTNELLKRNYSILGFDVDYFHDTNLSTTNQNLVKHISKDIRRIKESDIEGVDFVIHLAGLANDPLGEFDPNLTEEINYVSTVNFAKLCKKKK